MVDVSIFYWKNLGSLLLTIKWFECRSSQCYRKMQSIYNKPITSHNLLWASSKTFFVGASEHLQSWKKIWDTLVFIRNSALWEKSNFYFSEAFFASIDKICILWGRLDTKFSFYELLRFCYCFLVSLDRFSFKSSCNSSINWYMPCLLVIIMLPFICGERRICWNIRLDTLQCFYCAFKILWWPPQHPREDWCKTFARWFNSLYGFFLFVTWHIIKLFALNCYSYSNLELFWWALMILHSLFKFSLNKLMNFQALPVSSHTKVTDDICSVCLSL